jgi:hypothetical protein
MAFQIKKSYYHDPAGVQRRTGAHTYAFGIVQAKVHESPRRRTSHFFIFPGELVVGKYLT